MVQLPPDVDPEHAAALAAAAPPPPPTPTPDPSVVSQAKVTLPSPVAEPGYLTTEFWIAGVSAATTEIATLVTAFGGHFNSAQQAAVVAVGQGVVGLISAVYSLARSWRKRGTTA